MLLTAAVPRATAAGAAPTGQNDRYTVKPGSVLNVSAPRGVLANDSDSERDRLTAVLADTVDFGTLVLRSNGSFTYTPATLGGVDSFSYWAFDGTASSNLTSVHIKVDSKPVAKPDSYGVVLPGPRTVVAPGVLANDSDADGDILRAEVVKKPSFGSLTLSGDGGFTYMPASKKARSDFFTYRAVDGAGQKTPSTRVDLKISAANSPPVAVNDIYQIGESSAIEMDATGGVLANDTDADGDVLTAEALSFPFPADDFQFFEDGSFWYYPPSNWDSDVSFTYRVSDGTTFSAPATVTIDIVAVNSPPTGEDDQYWMMQGDVLDVPAPGVLANDYDDAEFDAPHVHDRVGGPGHGELTLNRDGSFIYTPDPDFAGVDGFTYRPADSSVGNVTFVTIEVWPAEES